MPVKKVIRLQGFDYASNNLYFITICTARKRKYFGEIRRNIVGLSEIGNATALFLQTIVESKNNVLDEFILMPNHLHCIINLKQDKNITLGCNQFSRPRTGSVSMLINHFKGQVKKWCNSNGFNHFQWQSRFYDRVIRNDEEYWAIKNYIINNPRSRKAK